MIVKTQYGDRVLNPLLMDFEKSTTYEVSPSPVQDSLGVKFKHVFTIDRLGYVESVLYENVDFFTGRRAGERHRKSAPLGNRPGLKFDRGHLLARELGAGMETINLVWMPNAINQGHKPGTAARNGFEQVAVLMERDLNIYTPSGGTPTFRGPTRLPNYRAFELHLKYLYERVRLHGFTISLEIRPMTFPNNGRLCTDIIYVTIFLDDKVIYKFDITNDVG